MTMQQRKFSIKFKHILQVSSNPLGFLEQQQFELMAACNLDSYYLGKQLLLGKKIIHFLLTVSQI